MFIRIFLIVLVIFTCTISKAQKDNFVQDTILKEKLRAFLIKRSEIYLSEENGFGKWIGITSSNLKTDSILSDKALIGIYKFRFAEIHSRSWLYIQYPNHLEFIDIDDLNIKKTMKKALRFFNKYQAEFTQEEIMHSLKGLTKTIYNNVSAPPTTYFH